MSYYRILIVGDSRVRNLQEELNATSLNLHFVVFTLPGANFYRICLKAKVEISYDDCYDLILLIGGINNLTRINRHPSYHIMPRYRSVTRLVNSTIDQMVQGVLQLQQITSTPITIPSLVGVRLVSYSPHFWRSLYRLQPIIDTAILQVNNRIRGINRLNNMRTIDLSSHVHRCVGHGGRYRTRYIHLRDGLHPGAELLELWAAKIVGFCGTYFTDLTHVQDRTSGYW